MDENESGWIYITEQTGRTGNIIGEVLSVTLFLVIINGILGELENEVNGSLFADDLAIYITTRN